MNNQPKSRFRIEYLAQIDSTNLEAIRRAEKGEPEGLVLAADYQTRGRGRLGRTWSAEPKSSLLVSVLIAPRMDPEHLGLIPILSGVALASALAEVSGFKPGLVWPNDLFGTKGKLGGILVESRFERDHLKFIVIGAGVNLSQKKEDFPLEIRARASSVFLESGKIIGREDLLLHYLDRLAGGLGALEEKNFSGLVEKYSEWDIIKGKELRVLRGGNPVSGVGSGIDLKGRLRVRSGQEEWYFSAGEITMVRERENAVSD